MTEHTDMEAISKMQRSLAAAWESIVALETKIDLLETKRVTEQAVDRPTNATFALIAELKAWRTEKWNALKDEGSKAPAYSVLGDRPIQDIAVNLPRDRYELAQIKGVGPDKLDKYGDDILAIVAKHRSAQADGDAPW